MTTPNLPPYRGLRELIGLSQRAVERELGWERGRLSTIERGLIPTESERIALMHFLNERVQAASPSSTPEGVI